MTGDAHHEEHAEWQDTYLADALVILDGAAVRVVAVCPVCGEDEPCRGGWEPEPDSVRAQRPAPRIRP